MPSFKRDGVPLMAENQQECSELSSESSSQSLDSSCPTEWDGLLCWTSTSAGQTATLPCPQGLSSNVISDDQVAIRHCLSNGTWKRNLGDSWTDYSACNGIDHEFTSGGALGVEHVLKRSSDFVTSIPIDHSNEGSYIYHFYKDVDIIRTLVNCISIVLLLTAIAFWCVVWANRRFGHPYRCVSFLIALVLSLVYHLVGLLSALVNTSGMFPCRILQALKTFAEIGTYTFFFLYVLLCIGIAMRRLESGTKFYSLVIVALLLPLILVIATTCLRLSNHPEETCDLLDDLSRHLWYERAIKCFLLFGTICILSVLCYWIFCFDNSLFKLNRDFLLIRHSSATLMLLACFCFFLELYEIVFVSQGPDGNVRTQGLARSGLILTVLMCSKGAATAFLLCFLDVEIFALIHSFPCCPDINNAVIDQAWEKRIRSESKVKFFEDSSSDDGQKAAASGTLDKEKDRVLPLTSAMQTYGSLPEDD